MKTTFIFLTDRRGLSLAEHAVAAAAVTQNTIKHAIIFCVGFEQSSDTKLAVLAKNRGFVVEYRTIQEVNMEMDLSLGNGAHAHVTAATVLKMHAMNSLLGEYERAIYLDNDILLMDSINLDSWDFEGFPIAAVYDIAKAGRMSTELDFDERCRQHGLSPHYFNAGFIAANYLYWDNNFLKRYNAAIDGHAHGCGYNANCSCLDQCAWNVAFSRSWKRLPLTFNFQACAIFSERWTYASVRHYVGKVKFVPYKAWRNDEKDTILLNEARTLLGLKPLSAFGARFIRRFNVWRNRTGTRAAYEAIARIEQMFNEKM